MLATSFAAVAGVAIAAYQALAPRTDAPAPPPVQVTVAVDPAKPAPEPAKSDSSGSLATDMAQGASFTAALNDGSEKRYQFAELFDGNPQTQFLIGEPDSEVNVLMAFAGGSVQAVYSIEYAPPNAGGGTAATQLDVMVLPDGQMSGSGSAIQSFELQTTPGKQTFTLPGGSQGKALWLRIAGPAGQGPIQVGEFKISK